MSCMEKINLDDLDQVTGGVIVETTAPDRTSHYHIVDDTTGETRQSLNSMTWAQQLAVGTFNTTDEVISPEEYKERFGKPFNPFTR